MSVYSGPGRPSVGVSRPPVAYRPHGRISTASPRRRTRRPPPPVQPSPAHLHPGLASSCGTRGRCVWFGASSRDLSRSVDARDFEGDLSRRRGVASWRGPAKRAPARSRSRSSRCAGTCRSWRSSPGIARRENRGRRPGHVPHLLECSREALANTSSLGLKTPGAKVFAPAAERRPRLGARRPDRRLLCPSAPAVDDTAASPQNISPCSCVARMARTALGDGLHKHHPSSRRPRGSGARAVVFTP